jgi:hypothetical protein
MVPGDTVAGTVMLASKCPSPFVSNGGLLLTGVKPTSSVIIVFGANPSPDTLSLPPGVTMLVLTVTDCVTK